MTPKLGHELSFAPDAMSSDTRTRNAIVQLKEPQGTYLRLDHRAKVNAIGVEPMNDGCPTGLRDPPAARCSYGHEASVVLQCCFGLFAWTVPCTGADGDDGFGPSLVTEVTCFGLLPLARLVEGDRPRFSYDFSLPAALVDGDGDRDTHTFHLTVGEMAPTLQDVSYLLGLPLRGDAMGPTDVGQGWREDLLARFGRVQRSGTAPPYREFAPTHTGGPPNWWILQFKADDIGVGATEYEIARHLEAYVLWLMGWVMFCSSAGSFVPKHLLRFARYVADAPLEAIPQFSWGSAVLAATYRGLCTGCLKSSGAEPIFGGVRYFAAPGSREVSDWSARGSTHAIPGVPDGRRRRPDNGLSVVRPTSMCLDHLLLNSCLSALTLKLNASQFAYAHVQTRKSYPDFVGQFDVLRDDEVRWEPYSQEAVDSRAPEGLSPLCVRDAEYWRTRSPLVFDIYVEEHAVHRVLRQFGLFQEIVVPASLLPPHAHRFTRQGQSVGQLWIPRLAEFVARWTTALDDVVMEGRPHDDAAWGHYLRWYLPRTRVRVLSTPQELPRRAPDVTDSYPTQRDQGASLAHDVVRQIQAEAMACSRASLTMAPQQHMAAYDKIVELCRRVTRSLSCRDDDVAFPLQPPMFRAPAPTPPPARPAPAQTTPMTYPPPGTQYGTHAGPSTRPPPYYQDAFAAGTSSRPPSYYQDPFAAGSSRARPIDWDMAPAQPRG
ncbi:hypothetical protein U9M48_011974 [Paspalum notatum var. saurae]|uniref:Aminotransferase-like plant mobile domain-containing protein n=1 Tax=Paspalum notatum var. saurae TaxID=547442 RepID=A0AAQ3WI82_PASNO